MAEIININTDKLIQAATTVADHLAAAAIPPAGALPPGLAPSPADLAAAGVDEILQAKIVAASTGLANVSPAVTDTTATATSGLQSCDNANAGRIAEIVDNS